MKNYKVKIGGNSYKVKAKDSDEAVIKVANKVVKDTSLKDDVVKNITFPGTNMVPMGFELGTDHINFAKKFYNEQKKVNFDYMKKRAKEDYEWYKETIRALPSYVKQLENQFKEFEKQYKEIENLTL